MPGLLVLESGDRPVNTTATIDVKSYSGTAHELLVYPQRAGERIVPAIPVRLTVAAELGQPAVEILAATEAVSLTARMPPGAERLSTLVSTTSFSAEQGFEGDDGPLSVGDAITRRVTLEASDVLGLAFLPLPEIVVPGATAYPRQPVVEDVAERGVLRGKRVETVVYVLERSGSVTLPTLALAWWNLETEALERVELPGRTIEVAPAPVVGMPIQAEPEESSAPRGLLLLLLALVAVAGAGGATAWKRRSIAAYFAARREERDRGEPALFARLESAAGQGDPLETFVALHRWLDQIHEGRETATLVGAPPRRAGAPPPTPSAQSRRSATDAMAPPAPGGGVLIAETASSHSFHRATFVLSGDWRRAFG